MNRAPTLYLTCGLPGSGKTTLARRLERQAAALRLTGDTWLRALWPDITTAEAETGPLRPRVEALQWRIAARSLALGANVVIDWGVWSRQERDTLRTAARGLGARVVLCLLDPPVEELWRRICQRNVEAPLDAFVMTREDLERWAGRFERPTPQELALFDPLRPDEERAAGGD